jgi:acyl-homoserine lactone synthase
LPERLILSSKQEAIMTLIIDSGALTRGEQIAANMHRDRKRIFFDLLGWDVPIIGGEYEIDQFDRPGAVYLVNAAPDGEHRGSIRLLPTVQPHILNSLFPDLCDGNLPIGSNIYEITRGCLSPRLRSAERLRVRTQLITAAVTFALENEIHMYTCVADGGWYSQILSLGWHCEPLGLPKLIGGVMTGAIRIRIERNTLRLLADAGTFAPSTLEWADADRSVAA